MTSATADGSAELKHIVRRFKDTPKDTPKDTHKDTLKFTINVTKLPAFREAKSTILIRRIAWSKDSTFLAALATQEDIPYIIVWDMKLLDPSNPENTTVLDEKCAVKCIEDTEGKLKDIKGKLKDISLGLAISADGGQVAIYQEPMVGQWADESELKDSLFEFRLFTLQPDLETSQLERYAPQSKQDIPESEGHIALDMHSGPETHRGSHISEKDNSKSAASPLSGLKSQPNQRLEPVQLPHNILKNFIGYGSFLTEGMDKERDIDDFNVLQPSPEDAKDDKGGKVPNAKAQPDSNNRKSNPSNMLFAACNGIYIDVFKVKFGHKWRHTHSIRLTDLAPTISRRIACQMMMDTISSNTFMWLEDDGVCCMLWDLQKGSNVSYVSSPDNGRLGSPIFHGNSTMSISPDESMVVLSSIDGTVTTFYANTGIAISSRKFSGQHIEYVAFNGRNSQLFMITRSNTAEFKSFILDPLQLNSSMRANQVPVPNIGRTIHAFFRDERFKDKGFVCKANGSNIQCYVSHAVVDSKVVTDDIKHVDPAETRYIPPPPKDEHKGEITHAIKSGIKNLIKGTSRHNQETDGKTDQKDDQKAEHKNEESMKEYNVRTTTSMKMRDDDGSLYWVLRVEVWGKDPENHIEKMVFSFVPEPWMRVPVSEVRQPKELQKVYFLPGQRRFVVSGMQTLQIWSLPTNEHNEFNLTFIWSRPKMRTDPGGSDGNAATGQAKTESAASQKDAYVQAGIVERAVAEQDKAEDKETNDESVIEDKDKTEVKEQIVGSAIAGQGTSGIDPVDSEPVGKCYHIISESPVSFNCKTGEVVARIKLKGMSGTDNVSVPGEHSGNTGPVFLHCARSIHLLAASYTYSIQESGKFPRELDKSSSTFEEHAEAIARFTRGHINHQLTSKHLRPPLLHIEEGTTGQKTQGQEIDLPTQHQESDLPSQLQFLDLLVQKTAAASTSLRKTVQKTISTSVQKPVTAPITILKRHSTALSDLQPPKPMFLKALECDTSTDQESSKEPCNSRSQSTGESKDPVMKLLAFLGMQKERLLAQKDKSTGPGEIFTVLTLLLYEDDLKDANHIFIEGLFDTEGHEWIPHPSVALNPIERIIDTKNERLLMALIDYCIRNARHQHPGYLTPVIQCLSELSEFHPDIVSDLFRKASYIPARNPGYVVSHAIVANLRFSDWINFLARFYTLGIFNRRLFGFIKSSDIHHYKNPIFSVRSQMPFYSHVGIGIIFDLVIGRQETFPQRKQEQPAIHQSKDIYVSPFRFKPIDGRDGRQDRSFLAEIAGKDFFGSPAIEASLWFKW